MHRPRHAPASLVRFTAAALLLVGSPASADAPDPWPLRLRAQMVQLARVEWRLRRAAAPLCPRTSAGFGLALDHIAAYGAGDRAMVASLLAMADAPQVYAVEPESPADRAGVRAGDEILAIDGVATADLLARSPDKSLFSDELAARMAAHTAGQPLLLRLRRAGTELALKLTPETICNAPFVLRTSSAVDAYSDGARLAVTSGLIAFTRDEDELALIAGHELAHVVNGDGKAKGLAERRRMEDDADVLGAAIARCAGYDVPLALGFWQRYRKGDLLGFLRAPTHGSSSARAAHIAGTAAAPCPLDPSATPGLR